MKSYPVKFECYDESGGVFKLEAFDEVCANLTIDTVISKDSWPEISQEIQKCLDQMFDDE